MTWSSSLAVLDTETTSVSAADARIVELGLVLVDDGQVAEKHAWLVNPGVPIPVEAWSVHGITDQRVAFAPAFEEIALDVGALLEGRVLAAYNARYDREVLLGEWQRAGVVVPPHATWIDPLIWARHVHRNEKGKKLEQVAQRLGVEPKTAPHRALADALTCTRVLFKLQQWMPTEYGAVVLLQEELRRKQENSFRAWRAHSGRRAG